MVSASRTGRALVRALIRALGRARVAVTLAVVSSGILSAPASAHPLHTSLTEISYDARVRAYVVSIRVFADDFGATVAMRTGAPALAGGVPADAAVARYVASSLRFADGAGRPLAPSWCGMRRAAEALFVCVRVAAPAGGGLRLRNALLVDRFADQVNIVRATVAGAVRTVLFTAGDGVKPVV